MTVAVVAVLVVVVLVLDLLLLVGSRLRRRTVKPRRQKAPAAHCSLEREIARAERGARSSPYRSVTDLETQVRQVSWSSSNYSR